MEDRIISVWREAFPVSDVCLSKEEKKLLNQYFPANAQGKRDITKLGVLRLIKDIRNLETGMEIVNGRIDALEDMLEGRFTKRQYKAKVLEA